MTARYVTVWATFGAAVLDRQTAKFASFSDASTADLAVELLNEPRGEWHGRHLFWEPIAELHG